MISTSNDFAEALFMLAVEKDCLKEFKSDLDKVKAVFSENPDYSLLLSSPDISNEKRAELIDAAFSSEIDEYIINFLKVLCKYNKIGLLEETVKIFSELKKQAENRVSAKVYSAVPLSDEQIEKLKDKLTAKLGSKVKIKTAIDPDIIGGIKIQFEDKIIDGSIKKQLKDIKEVITG